MKTFSKVLIAIVIFFISSKVYAQNIEIKDISIYKDNEFIEEINKPTMDNLNINFYLKYKEVEQRIIYKVDIKNNTDKYIDIKSSSDSKIIKYTLSNNESLKPHEISSVYLTISYDDAIPINLFTGDYFNDNSTIQLIIDEDVISNPSTASDVISNPSTASDINIYIIFILLIISIILSIFFFNRMKNIITFIFIILLIVPYVVLAKNINRTIIKCTSEILIKKPNSYSIYSWSDVPFIPNNIDDTLKQLRNLYVRDVYYSIDKDSLVKKPNYYQQMISKLNDNYINTYYLTGENSWYRKPAKIKEYIDAINDYNNLCNSDKEKIKGIVLDIEPYSNSTFKQDPINSFKTFSDTMESIYTYSKERSIDVVLVVPYWYDTKYAQGEDYTDEEKEIARNSLDKLVQNCDRLSIMNYYITKMVDHIEYEVSLAEKYSKEVESINNYQRPSENEKTSVWGQEDAMNKGRTLFHQVDDAYSYDKLTLSYHDLDSILEIKDLYQRYSFTYYDKDGNELIPDKKALLFSNNGKALSRATKKIIVPKNTPFDLKLNNYEVDSCSTSEGENKITNMTCIVSSLESYTAEFYSKYTTDGQNYLSINEGTLNIYDDIFENLSEVSIKEEGYAVKSRLYAGRIYQIYLNEKDNNYKLDSIVAKNESGEKVTISDVNGYMIIPRKFKENKYIAPTIYFRYEGTPPQEDPNENNRNKYQLDIYLRNINNQSIKVDGISITLKNLNNNIERHGNLKVADDGNYIYPISDVLDETVYQVIINQENTDYSIEDILIKNNSGSYISIKTDNNKFIIPEGTKSNLHANLRLILEE